MIGRNGWLEHRKGLNTAKFGHAVDRSRSITDIHRPMTVKCDTRGDSQTGRKFDTIFPMLDTTNDSIVPIRDKKLPMRIKGDAGWIHYPDGQLVDKTVRFDPEKCCVQLLPPGTRPCN